MTRLIEEEEEKKPVILYGVNIEKQLQLALTLYVEGTRGKYSKNDIESHRDTLAQLLEFWEDEEYNLSLLCMSMSMLEEMKEKEKRLGRHKGDLYACVFCGTHHYDVAVGDCPGGRETMKDSESVKGEIGMEETPRELKKKTRRTIPIVIKTRKFLRGRKEMREILEVSGLGVGDLPKEYLSEYPHVYIRLLPRKELVVFHADRCYAIAPGEHRIPPGRFEEAEFQKILGIIKHAGNRLAKIPYRKWEGEETFEI